MTSYSVVKQYNAQTPRILSFVAHFQSSLSEGGTWLSLRSLWTRRSRRSSSWNAHAVISAPSIHCFPSRRVCIGFRDDSHYYLAISTVSFDTECHYLYGHVTSAGAAQGRPPGGGREMGFGFQSTRSYTATNSRASL